MEQDKTKKDFILTNIYRYITEEKTLITQYLQLVSSLIDSLQKKTSEALQALEGYAAVTDFSPEYLKALTEFLYNI